MTRLWLPLSLCLVGATASAQDRTLFVRERGAAATPPPGAQIPEAPADDTGRQAADDARLALERAQERFLRSAFVEAAEGLRVVTARLTPALLPAHRELAVQLALWWGACAWFAHEPVESARAFERALALDPDVALPDTAFPPDVQSAFAEVARTHRAAATVTRQVRALPAGARIELDGRAACAAPCGLRLSRGPHHVRVSRVGYAPWSSELRAEADDAPPLEVTLRRADDGELRAQAGDPEGLAEPPDDETLASMGRAFGATRVVLARRDGSTRTWPPPPPPSASRSALSWVLGISGGVVALAAVITTVALLVPGGDPAGPRLNLILGF
ncbi:MAG: PEGA domain-containing protein [Polyangiales bacterium]